MPSRVLVAYATRYGSTREAEQEWRASRDQLAQELTKFPWLTPVTTEMFGGKYDPSVLRFPFNVLAGQAPASDIRDWAAIRTWAESLVHLLAV